MYNCGMRILFLILFLYCPTCLAYKLDPVMQKVAEALIDTETAKKYKKGGERYFYHRMKNDLDLDRKELANIGAFSYIAITGIIDSERIAKVRIRTHGIDFYPKIRYNLRETSGKVEFSVTIPFK